MNRIELLNKPAALVGTLQKWVDSNGNDGHGRGDSASGGAPLTPDDATPPGTLVRFHTPIEAGEDKVVYKVKEDRGDRVQVVPINGLDAKLPVVPSRVLRKEDLTLAKKPKAD